jgi:GT2 family glycosyltransferase
MEADGSAGAGDRGVKIGVIVYAFALAVPLENLLNHIISCTQATIYLFRHSEDVNVKTICDIYAGLARVTYYPFGFNRGLAKSCNEGLIAAYDDGCDVVVTVNDDVCLRSGDLERIARAALSTGTLATPFDGGHETACAAIPRQALERVGYFDENFTPAYYEDVDWLRRAKLAGLPVEHVGGVGATHQDSASLQHVPSEQHHKQFRANRSYYLKKWGGDRGEERWSVPFNNSSFGLKIEAKDRHNPYPEYARHA